jgi:glycine cleavage system transcriptional repressor
MHVAVTAVGADRPGIVAAVTRALYELGANIEDSRMAILGGHFAMMLIVALPKDVGRDHLEQILDQPARDLDLGVSVRPVAERSAAHADAVPYVVSVYGADQPGIVWRISEALAARSINISDLATHVLEGDPAVYVMVLEVELPPGTDAETAQSELKAIGAELGVDVSMNPMEPETL